MSQCTFLLIKAQKLKIVSLHYSEIKRIIGGLRGFDSFQTFDISGSDTQSAPAFIIDFDKLIIYSTNYNWFIDGSELTKGTIWQYKKSSFKGNC